MIEWLKSNGLGIGLCLLIAVPAWVLGTFLPVVGSPLFAIGIGMVVAIVLPICPQFQPGIRFCFKKILQLAVIFLGFGLNFHDIISQGKKSLPIIICTVVVALIVAFVVGKILRIESKLCTLIGVGSSICGGSAIAATSPVIDAEERVVAQAMSTIFFFNVVAALIFPMLGGYLGLSHQGFGIFAGTAINDTSSVTAAATAWDGMYQSNTLALATMVKLTRSLAIIPITIVIAIWRTQKQEQSGAKVSFSKIFPWFILFFLLAALVTTVVSLPVSVVSTLNFFSKFMIVLAMVAIGLQTNIVQLLKTGGKPLLLGAICWCSITVASLLMQRLLCLW